MPRSETATQPISHLMFFMDLSSRYGSAMVSPIQLNNHCGRESCELLHRGLLIGRFELYYSVCHPSLKASAAGFAATLLGEEDTASSRSLPPPVLGAWRQS